MKKKIYTLLAVLLINTMLLAQSNEPCSATLLTVNTTSGCGSNLVGLINPPTFTNSTSGSSGVTLPALTCNGFTTTTRDFWFRAVVPSGGELIINVYDGGDPATQTSSFWDMACYSSSSGTCAGSTFSLVASATECDPGTYPNLILSGLTPGSTLYIRMWREAGSAQTANRAYSICVSDPTVNAPTCSTYLGPVNATVIDQIPVLFWDPSSIATSYDIYFGSTNPPPFALNLSSPFIEAPSDLTPNSTRYWYVVPKNTAGAAVGCASNVQSFTTASNITNNDCSGAINLVDNVAIGGTTLYATQSRAASSCTGGTSAFANDVWYKFTTNSAGGAVDVDLLTFLQNGISMDAVVEAFSGTCGSLVSLGCIDAVGADDLETLVLTGLAPNSTFYVRVYGWQTAAGSGESALLFQPFDIQVSGVGVLPIELMSFTAKADVSLNRIEWQTASEKNVKVFDIEKSNSSDKNFVSIGTVKAVGNSNIAQSYSIMDRSPFQLSYYRLRTVDMDGSQQFSKVISVERKGNKFGINKIFPSPTNSEATIDFSTIEKGTVELSVIDVLGRVVFQKNMSVTEGDYSEKINVSNLANGTYFVQLKSGLSLEQARFSKN
jgi:Secretion system C-terminal sorting domain